MNRHRKSELEKVLKPGILMCQHSFSSDLSFHPHWHLIVSDGIFTPDGDFYHLWNWDTEAILEDLRSSILRAFVQWSKLSPEVAETLGQWESSRSGFSCFVTEQTPPDDKNGLGRLIRYLFRSPVSYRQLSYDESTGKVRCRSKRGKLKEWHATEFLAVLAQHVPRPRQHLVTYAGHYANAAGNLKLAEEPEQEKPRVEDANPGRPPPVPWQDPNESDDVFVDREFVENSSQQFHDDVNQIPPDWDSSFAIA